METEDLIKFRRHMHMHPEIGMREYQTQAEILSHLENIQSAVVKKCGGTGISVLFKGKNSGNKILIRGDIDALPIEEENDFEYRSLTKGISHKCGHDGHAAILLGLAFHLDKKGLNRGEVCLIFQPSEENGKGAKAILEDDDFKFEADMVFALHNLPGYPLHQIVCKPGSFSSAARSIIIKLKGKTSHAAEPEKGINPGLAIAEILKLSEELSQKDSTNPAFKLITLVYVKMGEMAYGVSAGEGEVHLTLRTRDNSNMCKLEDELTVRLEQIASHYKLKMETEWLEIFFANQNHKVAFSIIKEAASLNNFEFFQNTEAFKWGEDFGLFTTKFPGAMFGIGAGVKSPALHNPDYDFPDEIIETGIKMFASIINTTNV